MTADHDHEACPRCTCVDCTLRRQERLMHQERLMRIRNTRRMLGWPSAVRVH